MSVLLPVHTNNNIAAVAGLIKRDAGLIVKNIAHTLTLKIMPFQNDW